MQSVFRYRYRVSHVISLSWRGREFITNRGHEQPAVRKFQHRVLSSASPGSTYRATLPNLGSRRPPDCTIYTQRAPHRGPFSGSN